MPTQRQLIDSLREIRPLFEKEGVLLLGIFGSYARDEATCESDLDVLVETTDKFTRKYRGLSGFAKLDELRKRVEERVKLHVDIVDKQGLLHNGNRYILEHTLYV